jgi:hypothetical protein
MKKKLAFIFIAIIAFYGEGNSGATSYYRRPKETLRSA